MHGEGEHSHGDHHPLHHASIMKLGPPCEVDTPSICFWLVVLVGFTVFTERSLHALQHRLGKRSSPGNQMMHKVKDELMLMGLLSFCLNIADEAIDINHKDKLPFEWAHTLYFPNLLLNSIYETLTGQKDSVLFDAETEVAPEDNKKED